MLHQNLRGADLHSPSTELVQNATGSDIAALKTVGYVGLGTLGYPLIAVVNPSATTVRGITQAVVPDGGQGAITSLGFLQAINTSAFAVGSILYGDSTGSLSLVPNGLPVGVVLKQDATQGVIYVNNQGIKKVDLEALQFPDALSLELGWDILFPSYYTEAVYSSGQITDLNMYDTSAKAVHIFNKHLNYNTDGTLGSVVVTRNIDGKSITKAITYNVDGTIATVTRTYSV